MRQRCLLLVLPRDGLQESHIKPSIMQGVYLGFSHATWRLWKGAVFKQTINCFPFTSLRITTVINKCLQMPFIYFFVKEKERLHSTFVVHFSTHSHTLYLHLKTLLSSINLKIKIYKTIILPVVLYGFQTWSLILREECRLRVFENRILRRIFWPKRD